MEDHYLWCLIQKQIAVSITMRLGKCSSPLEISRHTMKIQSGRFHYINLFNPLQWSCTSVQAKVNAGSEEFQVIGTNLPAFLYEDLDKYDPKDTLSGLMWGYFLGHVRCFGSHKLSANLIWQCLRVIFSGPKTAMHVLSRDRPTSQSVAEKCSLRKITIPVMVYVAILVGVYHQSSDIQLTAKGLTHIEHSKHLDRPGWDLQLSRLHGPAFWNLWAWQGMDDKNHWALEPVGANRSRCQQH